MLGVSQSVGRWTPSIDMGRCRAGRQAVIHRSTVIEVIHPSSQAAHVQSIHLPLPHGCSVVEAAEVPTDACAGANNGVVSAVSQIKMPKYHAAQPPFSAALQSACA